MEKSNQLLLEIRINEKTVVRELVNVNKDYVR